MSATMDFFEHQDQARKSTGRLILLFAAAIVGIVLSTYALVMAIFVMGRQKMAESGEVIEAISWFQPELLGIVALVTLAVVGFGSMYKVAQLSGGGQIIAESLSGRQLSPDTTDLIERKVLNVVEEMAIASGTPVPPVYFLENEPGINAFAAGFSPEDAVIGITRGCAEQLSRDQLQGVVAHEFSHILNGDMRLNIRLIGIIHGILVVGLIGYFVMRMAFYSGATRSRSSNDKNSGMPLIALGVGLMLIGFIGTLFGNLIKAMISRQREFLADASAVQFTRNPEGIGGALKKIGGFDEGSALESPNAPEASHMFFSMGIKSGLNAMFATHPPLDERISRIDREWEFEKGDIKAQAAASTATASTAGASGFAGGSTAASSAPSLLSAESAVASIGQPTEAHVAHAHELIAAIPAALVDAARQPYDARAVVYALLLDDDDAIRREQLERLFAHADQGVFGETQRLHPTIEPLPSKLRLPLIDLAIPALRALSPSQYTAFRENVDVLVKADKKIDLFEWVLQKIVLRHLEPHFTRARPPRATIHQLGVVEDAVAVLLSALSYVGARDADAAGEAFGIGADQAGLNNLKQRPMEGVGLGSLDDALDQLAKLMPPAKRTLIQAAAATVAADGKITTSEAELLRAVADTLACPMPPLLSGNGLV
jgi:Zn-dependent protease with chaperone function